MEERVITMPVVALRGLTILPGMVQHFDVNRPRSVAAVEKAMIGDQKLFLVSQKHPEIPDPELKDLYQVGTIGVVKQLVKLPGKTVRVLVEGLERAELLDFDSQEPCLIGEISSMEPIIREKLEEYGTVNLRAAKENLPSLLLINDLSELLDQIAIQLPWDYTVRQNVLECTLLSARYETVLQTLLTEMEVYRIKKDFQEKVKADIDKNQKEYILREQMKIIRQELGEDTSLSDADDYQEKAEKLEAEKEVKEKLLKEIGRFRTMPTGSQEANVLRTYIETLLELPWKKTSKDNDDILHAQEVLNEDHYGLEKVKERILEYLAVRSLTKKGTSPIICLVGPPGTGKTSIARSVARALNKKYVRISLGGVRDEAEIRGHRKTYVGAMPGRLAEGLRQAGVSNPLMLLDEIDKASSDYTQTIPGPLLDRMEVIEVNSYTENEKFHIAKDYLVGKQRERSGLTEEQIVFSDKSLEKIIHNYTREAGVRNLERRIGDVCRKAARGYLEDKKHGRIRITESNLEKYLGKEKITFEDANEEDEVGIVRGLAWTSAGGDTLQIEVNVMPGKGNLLMTGQLGDVMKESAQTALTYVRSICPEYGLADDYFEKHDLHIHIPEGAVPKDGPSAGITMATAMLSAVTGKKVLAKVAMTGEITLRGRVLPIGGLKEKILAAKMAHIKKVLVPEKNRPDIGELSKEITKGLEIVFVKNMEAVVKEAFA